MQFLPTQKSPKLRSRSRLLVVEEDCSEENKVAGRMKLKMHNKIIPNSCQRGGAKEKKEERANGGKEDHALDFKMLMQQSLTVAL